MRVRSKEFQDGGFGRGGDHISTETCDASHPDSTDHRSDHAPSALNLGWIPAYNRTLKADHVSRAEDMSRVPLPVENDLAFIFNRTPSNSPHWVSVFLS